MWWLWFVGPVIAVVVYALTERRDRRREGEIAVWRKASGNPKRVTSMPGPLTRILDATGGGKPLGYYELVEKLAYLVTMSADPTQGSDHATIVAKLDETGPTFTARPLPIIEGERVPNTGVQFAKDTDFMAQFLVEPTLDEGVPAPRGEAEDKAIRKWLSPPLRDALLDFPSGWLRVDGKAKVMALTLYGPADADLLEALVETADIVFAEHGAEGGPSLLPEEEEEAPAPKAPPPKKKSAASSPKPAAKR